MKIIKHDCCTQLSEDRLDQLIRIKVDGPPLEKWDAADALGIWYKEKSRRVSAKPRPSTINASKALCDKDCVSQSEPFSMDE